MFQDVCFRQSFALGFFFHFPSDQKYLQLKCLNDKGKVTILTSQAISYQDDFSDFS